MQFTPPFSNQTARNRIYGGHPVDIDENYGTKSMRYDLSLLELEKSLVYSDKIQPACLLSEDKLLRFLEFRDVSAWGLTETGNPSQRVLHAQISYLDDYKCKSKFDAIDLDTMVYCDSD